MQKRHQNKDLYFQEQVKTTRDHVIPYIGKAFPVTGKSNILEIGCGEGGNLLPFLELGCNAVGIDLSESKINLAKHFLKNFENIELIADDIYNTGYLNQSFDLIILRDVIEHLPGQEFFMEFVKKFLHPDGKIFLGFPPWQNPFGGHQQVLKSKIFSKLPYFHLLPAKIYRFILMLSGADDASVKGLLEIKETGISIDRFEKILKKAGYSIDQRTFYLINPNYETKFGMKPRVQSRIISVIPWLRNYFTTAAYYLISTRKPDGLF